MILSIQFQAVRVGESIKHLESLFTKKDETTIALVKDPSCEMTIDPEEFVQPAIRVINPFLQTPQRYQNDTWGAVLN